MIKLERSALQTVLLLISVFVLAGCTLDVRHWQMESSKAEPDALTLSISGPAIAAGTSATNFVFTVNYLNAAAVTLVDTDIVLVGADTAGCVAVVTGTGETTRTVTVSGCTGDGPMSISIAANTAMDALGNQALASDPSSSANVQNSFITTFDTTKLSAGSSANNQVALPLTGWSGYNFTVYWGDGQSETITSATWTPALPAITHTYASAGIYEIKFKGAMPNFQFFGSVDRLKIIDVKQWGTNEWWNMEMMFAGCGNLQMSATDAPNLSAVTSLKGMFAAAYTFNGAIGNWDTSHITDMESLFHDAKAFNRPIGNWDISHVVDTRGMFNGAEAFNQDISHWDTSSIVDMSGMFAYALAFNQPINSSGGHWNTSNVTSMSGMFMGAAAFNQDIKDWNRSSIVEMNSMFLNAFAYDQNLSSWNIPNTVSATTFSDGADDWAPSRKPNFLP